jgi:hypothetical protein
VGDGGLDRYTDKQPSGWERSNQISRLQVGLSVGKLRRPLLSAALWGETEQVPERPDQIDVAGILSRFGGRKEKFGMVEVVYCAVAAHENIQRGTLFALGRFATVIMVVGIWSGGEL